MHCTVGWCWRLSFLRFSYKLNLADDQSSHVTSTPYYIWLVVALCKEKRERNMMRCTARYTFCFLICGCGGGGGCGGCCCCC